MKSFYALLFLIGCFFWLWMLIGCLRGKHPHPNDKLIWTLVLIFLPVIGSIIYFFVGRPRVK